MISVGITGGIGSGKSTICRIFQTLGIAIYQADDRAKHLMNVDEFLIREIKHLFGEESYLGGKINRDFLAQRVFNNGNEILKLNQLVHPAVKLDFDKWKSQQSGTYVIKEAALLIESGSYRDLDFLVVVHAAESIRVERVLKRDPFRKKSELEEILKKQTTDQMRVDKADYLIDNNGTELVIPQVLKLHDHFVNAHS